MSKTAKLNLKITWRDTWYSVVVWLSAIVVGGFVILPWYYLVLPLAVFWTTVIYFGRSERTLAVGLFCSLFWFFAAAVLDFLEIIGPYYANAAFYFSDSRNWLKYPLILLIPVIYSLVLETRDSKKKKSTRLTETIVELARL
ncbi:hypothetical protein HYZ70_02945 [Candidatus Curtissbacteria bacterium]|nr:hypothetical protein [Candidatus Curtissbacteria bacterium]